MSGVGGVVWVQSIQEFAASERGSMKGSEFHDYLEYKSAFQEGHCHGISLCRMLFNFKSFALLQWISQAVQSS